jgi:hypothetical protein
VQIRAAEDETNNSAIAQEMAEFANRSITDDPEHVIR